MKKKDSVQETDLTSRDIYSYDLTDTVDAGDFFEIAKTDKEYKITASDLIKGLNGVPEAYRDSDSNDIIINPTATNADMPDTVRTISSLQNVRVRFEPVWTMDDGNDYIMKFIINLDVPDGTRVFLDLLFKPTINVENNTPNVSAPIFQVAIQGDTIPIHDYRDSVSSGNYRGLKYHYEMVGWYEVVKVTGKNRLIKA